MMDVKGLMKSVGAEGLLRLTLHICEEGLRLTEEATMQMGHPVTTWTLLLDLEGYLINKNKQRQETIRRCSLPVQFAPSPQT